MVKVVSIASSLLFLFLFSSVEAKNIEPEKHKKAVESFKQDINEYKMAMSKGDLATSSKYLKSLSNKAEDELQMTKEKKEWMSTHKCNAIDQEKVAYQIKSRLSKQTELIIGFRHLAKVGISDMETAERTELYLESFYDSMKDNLQESESIANTCGL